MSMNSFHSRGHRAAPKRERTASVAPRPTGLQRLDTLLVAKGLVESRTRARQLIKAGRVSSDEGVIVKPGHLLPESARLTVAEDEQARDVSRGALKGGVVRDEAQHETVERTIPLAAQELGLAVRGSYESPLTGGGVGNIDGNREFLIWMQHRHDNQD